MDFNAVDTVSAALSLKQGMMMSEIGTAVLAKAIDTSEELGSEMINMMERSVNPAIGGNVDVRL
ncbi:MAG: YjfB family protein [Lachnospiraceae bacterium]|nr:YjfB family protein [Lachnospiraceae bacterium]